jgi:quinate dehydrogenase
MESQDASQFLPALKQPDVIGCAATMPYKAAMMSSIDELTEEGHAIGAINTVFLRRAEDGTTRYIGTNTDCIGIREAFIQSFSGIHSQSNGKPALVVGGGGACRAAIFTLSKWLKSSKIYLVNRLEEEVSAIIQSFKNTGSVAELVWVSSVEQAERCESPLLVVGTVPDFEPKTPGEILARQIVNTFLAKEKKGYVLEMCYHPKPTTEFFDLCERAGWNVLYGTESMIWQGVAQQALWAEMPLENFKLEQEKTQIREALHKSH